MGSLHDLVGLAGHSKRSSTRSRRQTTKACTLYTSPLATDTLPVYTNFNLTWDPTCVTMTSDNVDLYLSVEEDAGLVAVHEWTDVVYADGFLETQLKPSWWNASTGAGTVAAQFAFTPSGSPIWDTPAPSGPLFSITYNGTYPSTTDTASTPSYTGPSVESGNAGKSDSGGISGGRLGAAVAVPLLAVAIGLYAYLAWNKLRKRPEKKRWSAVIDQRMSMISQGTWQPPRGSMSSRPGSFHPGGSTGRASASVYSNLEGYRHSFAEGGRPSSSYSNGHTPSPLAQGFVRPLPPAEMRQVGSGDRGSRVSFIAGEGGPRPSFTSSRKAPTSIYTRSSVHGQSNLRRSVAGMDADVSSMPSSTPPSPPVTRSGTREELAEGVTLRNPYSTSAGAMARQPGGNAYKASVASSLGNDLASFPAIAVVRNGALAYSTPPVSPAVPQSPFLDSSETPNTMEIVPPRPPRPTLQPLDSHMPMANRNSMMSPDQALASYAVQRDAGVASPPPPAHSPYPSTAQRLTRSASSFLGAPARMIRSFTSSSSINSNSPPSQSTTSPDLHNNAENDRGRGDGVTSPFADPITNEKDPYAAFDESEKHGGPASPTVEVGPTRRARTTSLHSSRSPLGSPSIPEEEEMPPTWGVAM